MGALFSQKETHKGFLKLHKDLLKLHKGFLKMHKGLLKLHKGLLKLHKGLLKLHKREWGGRSHSVCVCVWQHLKPTHSSALGCVH